jgi:hypothetical protein
MCRTNQTLRFNVTLAISLPLGRRSVTVHSWTEIDVLCSNVVEIVTSGVVKSIIVVELGGVVEFGLYGYHPIGGAEQKNWVGPGIGAPDITIGVGLEEGVVDTINLCKSSKRDSGLESEISLNQCE